MAPRIEPIESSPEIFNAYLSRLGIDTLEFTDVYGLDEELLSYVPRPVYAVLLVFPINDARDKYQQEADKSYTHPKTAAVWSKQTVENTCGTMALLHALANGAPEGAISPESLASALLADFKNLDEKERHKFVEENAQILDIHKSLSEAGNGEGAAKVDHHYVCLTRSGDELLELDGRRRGPIVRGRVSGSDVLPAAVSVIREYVERERENPSFAILAMVDK